LIAIAFDWFVLDVLAVIIIREMPSSAALFKWKGYLFDEDCHFAWKNQKKVN